MATLEAGPAPSDRVFFAFNAAISAAALAFLGWLLVLHQGAGPSVDLSFMPAVNASMNAAAAILLCAGWVAIRRRKVRVHKFLMVSAFAASALFFLGYAIYHYAHGDTHYQGTGPLRAIYFTILASHVVLSAAVVPLALTALWFAYRKRFPTHRKIARVTLPIWLYVSVTGVLIYFMLRP